MLDRDSFSQLQDGPPRTKAETVSDTGGASVVTYLRKGKNAAQQL